MVHIVYTEWEMFYKDEVAGESIDVACYLSLSHVSHATVGNLSRVPCGIRARPCTSVHGRILSSKAITVRTNICVRDYTDIIVFNPERERCK